MSATVQFYDSDGATQLTDFDFGDINGGNHVRPKKFGVRSTSDRVLNGVNQLLEAIAGNDGIDMVSHAADPVTIGTPFGPSSMAPQITLSASGAGGIFSAIGVYGYKVTWLNVLGETIGSSEATINVDDVTKVVTLLWNTPVPVTATGAKVYRTSVPGTYSGTNLRATIGATNTYVDNGAALTTGAPPAVNSTAGFSLSAVLSAPAAGGIWPVIGSRFWRVVGYDADDIELANSFEATVNVNDTTKTVALTWLTITGASKVRVWRSSLTGVYASPALVIELAGGAIAYTDIGSAATTGTLTSTPSYGIPPTVFATGPISEGIVDIGEWYFIWVLIDVPINTPEVGNPRLVFETAQES